MRLVIVKRNERRNDGRPTPQAGTAAVLSSRAMAGLKTASEDTAVHCWFRAGASTQVVRHETVELDDLRARALKGARRLLTLRYAGVSGPTCVRAPLGRSGSLKKYNLTFTKKDT